jgi:hypothetical protein
MSAAREHEPLWAFLTQVGPLCAHDDGPRPWHRGDPADAHLREVLERIANLAGWVMVAPFDLQDREHTEALREAVGVIAFDAAKLLRSTDARLASIAEQAADAPDERSRP